jgi:hypothetical protein
LSKRGSISKSSIDLETNSKESIENDINKIEQGKKKENLILIEDSPLISCI